MSDFNWENVEKKIRVKENTPLTYHTFLAYETTEQEQNSTHAHRDRRQRIIHKLDVENIWSDTVYIVVDIKHTKTRRD